MEILEQGNLRLEGAECFGSIADASLHQELGNHGILTATVWLSGDGYRKESGMWTDLPVSLVPVREDRIPLFSGLVRYAAFQDIGGRPAVRIKAYSHTVLLEGEKRDRSFQQESRTCGELVRSILKPYQAAYIWSGKGRDEAVGRFLMQYGENDWEFLRRVASFHGHAVIPEVRFPGAKMFIGLPAGRKEAVLEADSYRIKKSLDKSYRKMDNKTTGGLSEGLEIEVSGRYEDYSMGDPVRFLDRTLITAGKHSYLKGNQWVHDYRFRPAENCRMERMDNLRLAGAAVRGRVLGTTQDSSRLALATDQEGEQAESLHIQPVYYTGGGKGYSGRPEKGDTQYLYFPTEREGDRYIIGGADAGAERIMAIVGKAEAETAAEMAAEDSRTGQGNGEGTAGSGTGREGASTEGGGGTAGTGTGGEGLSAGSAGAASAVTVSAASGSAVHMPSGGAVTVPVGETGSVPSAGIWFPAPGSEGSVPSERAGVLAPGSEGSVSAGRTGALASGSEGSVSAGGTGALPPESGVSMTSGRGSRTGGSVPAGASPQTGSPMVGKGGGPGAGGISGTKNWSTPGSQSLVLNGPGISLSNGSRSRICVMENGIRVCAEGDMDLYAEDACLEGAGISMEAKEYVWLKSQDSSVLLMPDAVHMKAADVYIRSPESGLHPVFTEDSVERIFSMYEERKKSAPPLYASDGSLIRPEGYDDILYSDEMLEYFEKNVYGKGEYENPLGQPVQLFYDSWLEETYGKTGLKKFWEYLGTADGIQDMLDVAGIFLEPADLLNAGISLCRGNWEEAALSLVCVFPLVGDLIGKGGKGLKRVSSAGMETVLKRVSSAGTETVLKAVKTGEKVLDRLEITYKALSGKTEELKRYLDEVAEMMHNACRSGPEYRLCLNGGGYYLDEGTELFFKIVDDTGESVSYTRRIGNTAADGLDGVRDASRYVDEAVDESLEASIKNIDDFIGGTKSFDDVLDDYAKVYADKINSNQAWSWNDTIPGGENLTKKQRSIIKQQAIDAGLIPDIKVINVEDMRYGFADFESAGVVKETQYLPENMWKMSDAEQFRWLDEQIGGAVDGYTWHHTEIPGKMQLVPTGIHNITTHNGGRTAGMWADAPR